MADTFNFTDNYKKTFIGMIILGVVLLLGGFFLSNAKFGEEHGHGAEHHGTTEHGEHSSIDGDMVKYASADRMIAQGHGDDHGDSHDDGHGDDAHGAAHATGGHDDGHGDHGIDESAWTSENGTVWRAPIHPEQVHHVAHAEANPTLKKFGASLLMAGWWWLAVALFGVFFQAFSAVANAGWHVAFKRVPEVFYRFIPIGGFILIVTFLALGKDVYEWVAIPAGEDSLIDGKRSLLNPIFYMGAMVLFIALWTLFGHLFRTTSLKEDTTEGTDMFKRMLKFSAIFLPIFAVSFSLAAFQWLMSLEPHWFSTMFSVYMFAGTFVSGVTIITLIVISLKEKGYLPAVQGSHIHDLGKLMFAFSVFWGYIFVSQYLLIWYANIPEETIYFYNRLNHYKFLFTLNVVLNFFVPFLALMTRNSKREYGSLKSVAVLMLLGRFLDLFLVVMPGVVGEEWNAGLLIMSLGMMILVGGVFFFAVFTGLAGKSLAPVNHPYFEESTHHDTGV